MIPRLKSIWQIPIPMRRGAQLSSICAMFPFSLAPEAYKVIIIHRLYWHRDLEELKLRKHWKKWCDDRNTISTMSSREPIQQGGALLLQEEPLRSDMQIKRRTVAVWCPKKTIVLTGVIGFSEHRTNRGKRAESLPDYSLLPGKGEMNTSELAVKIPPSGFPLICTFFYCFQRFPFYFAYSWSVLGQ